MLEQPKSMDECVYFTRRTLENGGKIMAWAYRIDCPKCGKAKMGKPVEKGKVKRRAKEYICPECGHTEEKEEHEPKLTLEVIYTCPHCGHEGEAKTEYKRKTFEGVPAYVFKCEKCGNKIGVTKKMKEGKKKGKGKEVPDVE
ncbi:MAG: hypothetical protein R6U32_03240 [Candidatus Woesearchaeota archaeon]